MTALSFFGGMAAGVVLTLTIMTSTADQGEPTNAEIMQMLPFYCGTDGCQ